MTASKMQLTTALGADFWNDSCDLDELAEACAHGAVGATSNPVIVNQVVDQARATWTPVLADLVRAHPEATEVEIAWRLVEAVAVRAAEILAPVHERTEGRRGRLCVQVNPQFYRSASRMAEHGRALAALAPNLAIKVPATAAGLSAIEELAALGIATNATVSFSVSQAVACAEAVERGLQRARDAGRDVERLRPVVTIMVGRLDDHLQRVAVRERTSVDPGFLHWAGIAVFKKAHRVFTSRPYQSTLLAAAYRHVLHWSELVGEHAVLSMPYAWWTQFNASSVSPSRTLGQPAPPRIVDALYFHFEDFRRAYDEDGLAATDFATWGPSRHTLQQFLGGHAALVERVRAQMLEG